MKMAAGSVGATRAGNRGIGGIGGESGDGLKLAREENIFGRA